MLTTMLRSIRGLYEYHVHAMEGNIGEIKEFYLQDQEWKLRFLKVKAAVPCASAKEIYLSSDALEEIDPEKKVFFFQQTKQAIEDESSGITHLEKDAHLKPSKLLLGFTVNARDGEIGRVEDLILNDADLTIRYLVVQLDTLNKKFVLSPWWAEKLFWETRDIFLGSTLEEVCQSPPYDFSEPVSREYEDRLHDYYGRRSYWA